MANTELKTAYVRRIIYKIKSYIIHNTKRHTQKTKTYSEYVKFET